MQPSTLQLRGSQMLRFHSTTRFWHVAVQENCPQRSFENTNWGLGYHTDRTMFSSNLAQLSKSSPRLIMWVTEPPERSTIEIRIISMLVLLYLMIKDLEDFATPTGYNGTQVYKKFEKFFPKGCKVSTFNNLFCWIP